LGLTAPTKIPNQHTFKNTTQLQGQIKYRREQKKNTTTNEVNLIIM
jgi:hypothetical protein